MTAMNSDERLAAARAAKYGVTYSSLELWASSQDLSGPDEEVKKMISAQFGFADDEKIHPSRVIKLPDPRVEAMLRSQGHIVYADMPMEKADEQKALNEIDLLIKGRTYALATNGYVLGKYKGLTFHKCPRGTKCGCRCILWSFDQGDRGDELWSIGVYQVD
uniref:Uncharacterized protein n=1 Tax=viral metagenome TaxID=1070528 RepID=A0A6C0JKN4_9ZZZZ